MGRVSSAVLVADLQAALVRKDGYIMGAKGQNPKTGYMDLSVTKVKSSWKPDGYYYTQYSGKQREKALYWREHATRVWDCNGMSEGIYELHTGVNIDSKARYNYAQWCDPKGSGMIPANRRVPGAAVFWSDSGASSIHHVAYLEKPVKASDPAGDWYIIEARGVMYGVVRTKLLSRKPNFWGWMTKYYDYEGSSVKPKEQHLGDRVLYNGCEGEDVKELQTDLIRLGYSCGKWGVDGEFGDSTEMAVRRFQTDYDLVVDGIFDQKSYEVMMQALAENDSTPETPKQVEIVGGNCYVRSGPGTKYEVRGVAREGEKLPFGGMIDEESKWLSVMYKDQIGWVSPKYSRLI